MKLSPAPFSYDRTVFQAILKQISESDAENFKKSQDLRLQRGERVILMSPNGTLYFIKVDNSGTLSTTAV